MKRTIFLAVLGVFILAACKKKTINQVEKEIVDGKWKIALYTDDGQNETSNYSSVSFTFGEDGSVLASVAGSTVSGTWSTGLDDDHSEFILTMNAPLQDLNDDWHIIDHSDSKLSLEDVSGDGSIDQLVFEKI